MFKRVRRFLETTEGKLKTIILVSGFIIIMSSLFVGALKLTNTPAFCKSCHEMYPEYYTWENSAHNKIACISCHIKPGTKNFLVHKIKSLSQVYYHITQSYMTPIDIKEKVDSYQCESCHDMSKRVTTTSGDLKFGHSKHLNKKIECVVCHKGVAHGQIEEKGFTAMTNYNSWNSQVGKAYVNSPVSKYYTNLQMKQCIDCHKEKNAPVTCNTCHSKIAAADVNHKVKTWVSSTHGKLAAKDIISCDKCHSLTSKYQGAVSKDITIVEYARTNTFCNTCHSKKPADHTNTWKKDHKYPAANSNSRIQCLVCHNDSGAKPGDNVPVDLSCQSCHTQTHKTLDLKIHPSEIPPSGYGAECASCHVTSLCEKCHAKAQN